MKTRKQIMTEAHEIARTLEGDYTARLSEGLRIVWGCIHYEKRLAEKNVKDIFEELYYGKGLSRADEWMEESETILEVVAENSKGFQSDIAKKALKYKNITKKQAWCVAYEYKNVA